MKNTLIIGAVVIVVLAILFFVIQPKETTTIPVVVSNTEQTQATQPTGSQTATQDEKQLSSEPEPAVTPANGRIAQPDTVPVVAPSGKLKADTFSGTLQKVDTGCFSDGECYVEVDGKHVTALIGWSQAEVGGVQGVEGFGDLEKYIGKQVEVYAQVNTDGTFTLYGSKGFYIKPI